MIDELQIFALQTYVVLAIIGIIFIFFRADRHLIFQDLKEYAKERPILAIISVVLVILIKMIN